MKHIQFKVPTCFMLATLRVVTNHKSCMRSSVSQLLHCRRSNRGPTPNMHCCIASHCHQHQSSQLPIESRILNVTDGRCCGSDIIIAELGQLLCCCSLQGRVAVFPSSISPACLVVHQSLLPISLSDGITAASVSTVPAAALQLRLQILAASALAVSIPPHQLDAQRPRGPLEKGIFVAVSASVRPESLSRSARSWSPNIPERFTGASACCTRRIGSLCCPCCSS